MRLWGEEMAKGNKRKKAQLRVLGEIKNQLILQAERWGKKDYYTPFKLEEMELEQCSKIRGELLAEKANLEYELHLVGSDKKDVLIKIERITSYIKRADWAEGRHQRKISAMIEKLTGDKAAIKKAQGSIEQKHFVSVLINDN